MSSQHSTPLRSRTQEITAEYWEVRDEQSERVAVAQLILQFALLEEQLDSEQRLREAAEQQYAAAEVQYGRLKEQLQAERREEWREGIVNVLDHEGNYLGCMGSETWAWTLDGGIERMKEQLETARSFLVNINQDADEALLRMRIERALECLGSNPAKRPGGC